MVFLENPGPITRWDETWSDVQDGNFTVTRYNRDHEPLKFNIFEELATGRRSIFRDVPVQDVETLLKGRLEVSTLTPSFKQKTPDAPKASVREGFLVQRTGDPLEFLYFAYPGAMLLTNPWGKQPESRNSHKTLPFIPLPTRPTNPVYLNGLRGQCHQLSVLRSLQVVGLLEFLFTRFNADKNAFARKGFSALERGTWWANIIACNSTVLFRIKSSDLTGLLEDPKFGIGSRTAILTGCIRELSLRLSEIHLSKVFSATDQDHLVLAKHLLDYSVCSGMDVFESNKFRVEFYTGLSAFRVNAILKDLESEDHAVRKILHGDQADGKHHGEYQLNIDVLERIVNEWRASIFSKKKKPKSPLQ